MTDTLHGSLAIISGMEFEDAANKYATTAGKLKASQIVTKIDSLTEKPEQSNDSGLCHFDRI